MYLFVLSIRSSRRHFIKRHRTNSFMNKIQYGSVHNCKEEESVLMTRVKTDELYEKNDINNFWKKNVQIASNERLFRFFEFQ